MAFNSIEIEFIRISKWESMQKFGNKKFIFVNQWRWRGIDEN